MTVRGKGNIIMKLMGYKRENGTFGIRNHLLILPTSVCSSETAQRIAALVPGAVAIPHQHGCCQVGADYLQTVNTLVGFGKNPNVGAVLVVSLGCEGIQPEVVADQIRESKKPVETVIIQECGGTLGCIAKGAEIAAKMARELSVQNKVAFDISELVLGLECGGSDPTSGIAGNPSVGAASDQLIQLGGTSILSETTELIGAEHLVAARCVTKEMGDKLTAMVKRIEDKSKLYGVDLRGTQPTPGNIAGGAQIILFTTGRGTPTGSPVAPVIKVTGNPETYAKMTDNIDINAGRVITEGKTPQDIGAEIFDKMVAVANGELTKAEVLGHKEFGIYRIGDTF